MENRWRRREIWRIFVTEQLMEEELERKKRKVNEPEMQLAKTHSKQAVSPSRRSFTNNLDARDGRS